MLLVTVVTDVLLQLKYIIFLLKTNYNYLWVQEVIHFDCTEHTFKIHKSIK